MKQRIYDEAKCSDILSIFLSTTKQGDNALGSICSSVCQNSRSKVKVGSTSWSAIYLFFLSKIACQGCGLVLVGSYKEIIINVDR